jgi:histone acetyltransferase (RNA polymerase elongator complex component)
VRRDRCLWARNDSSHQERFFQLVKPFLDSKTHIRISTRPDKISEKILAELKENGVKTIELGIQSFSDSVLTATNRGYLSDIAINNCNLVKDFGFDLGIQIMPGLPDFNQETLELTLQKIIEISPKFIRIYPAVVLADTELATMYFADKYAPLSLEEAIDICSKISILMQENNIDIIKMGLHSDIDSKDIVAGPYHESFGELVRAKILYDKIIRNYQKSQTLNISKYDISLFKGFSAKMLGNIKSQLNIENIPIIISDSIKKNEFILNTNKTEIYW